MVIGDMIQFEQKRIKDQKKALEEERKEIEKHTRYEYPIYDTLLSVADMVNRICNLFWFNTGVWCHRTRTYRNTGRNRYYGGDIRDRNQKPIILYTKGRLSYPDQK